jgi:hypothetical protein
MAAAETRVPTAKITLVEREASMDGKVPPRRLTNTVRRPREYLTAKEIERLIAAAKSRRLKFRYRRFAVLVTF